MDDHTRPGVAKQALCIGINNYPGTGSDLAGCVNDANDWKAVLDQRGFAVRLLLDEQATHDAICQGIQRLLREAQPEATVVITYSGHGSWIPDRDGDEPDRRDEVLCPYDIAHNRPLVDDELYAIFAERKPGVRIVLISDSCHSGSVTRLAPPPEGGAGPRVRFLPPEHFLPAAALRRAAEVQGRRTQGTPRPFGGLLLSGCQDSEVSYDARFNGRPNGAFTYFALKALKALPPGARYRDWYQAIRAYLPNRSQPQTPNFEGTPAQKAWEIFATTRRYPPDETRTLQTDARLHPGSPAEWRDAHPTPRRATMATINANAEQATGIVEQTVRKVLRDVLNEVSYPAQPTRAAPPPPSEGDTPPPPEQGGGGATTLPPAVATALQAVLNSLSPEQAQALAGFFEAMGGQPGRGEDAWEEATPLTEEEIAEASTRPDVPDNP
ncbi:caspase family protein [Candidatus Methylocalor cossyra]|uniref:Enzyme n=1 Tax=Candidatus Methylocalor cossyra TaxID=3108543 RepID=A0ABM9NJV5_9GAMM